MTKKIKESLFRYFSNQNLIGIYNPNQTISIRDERTGTEYSYTKNGWQNDIEHLFEHVSLVAIKTKWVAENKIIEKCFDIIENRNEEQKDKIKDQIISLSLPVGFKTSHDFLESNLSTDIKISVWRKTIVPN